VYQGHGCIKTANIVEVFDKSDSTILLHSLETDKIIIATGSKPICPPSFNYDKQRIITSTESLNLTVVPNHIVIVGAGVIGMELGSVYARLGSKVSVVEYADSILGGMDADLGKDMLKTLRKELGFTFYLAHGVDTVSSDGAQITLSATARKDGAKLTLQADYCLIAIGRKPYTDNLGLENVGVEKDERGRIKTNSHLQTNIANIFAIGDVIQGAMLAHKAEEEGVLVAEFLAGQKPHINYNLIPGIVYTWPEVASVGQTEEQLKTANVPYKSGKFFFRALGRARASGDTSGFVKILAHKDTDEVLGMHIIGARAADIIMEGVAAMEFRASAEDIARFSHGHPTYTEAVKEAALDCTDKRSLHS
jgi:dihydrolipoamide dehydrogenase